MTDTDKLKSMIANLEGQSVYSRLAPLMADIDSKIKGGVPRAEIYEVIKAQGFELSEGSFYTYLYRYRKRNSVKASPGKSSSKPKPPSVEQNGNSEASALDDERDTVQTQQPSFEVGLDLLSNENNREEFTNQFMERPSIRKGVKR
jgi:hypothetical protein